MSTMTRRRLLAAIAGGSAVVVTGCTPPLPGFGSDDPDSASRRISADSERELIAAYEAAFAAIPSLKSTFGFIAEQHREHLAALHPDAPAASPPAGSVDTRSRNAAVRSLRMLETGAARQRAVAGGAVSDATLVELLVRIGAAESGHAAFLAQARP